MDVVSLAEELGARAREAAARGRDTFAADELRDASDWIAGTSPDPELRDAAVAWASSGARYQDLVRLCARAVLALDRSWPPSEARYRDKAAGELEPMLALWPDVLLLPAPFAIEPMRMVELRALPVHPLGLVAEATWTDGAPGAPSEFFFHDLDHARFKVREDLLVEGVDVPDAYQNGTTIDPGTGRHRLIMPAAAGRIGDRLWRRVPARAALARRLRVRLADVSAGPLRAAAELLLFELIHEKSLPLEVDVLARELAGEAHLDKLRWKASVGFFPGGTDADVVAALPAARTTLREMLR